MNKKTKRMLLLIFIVLLLGLGAILNYFYVWGICFDHLGGFRSSGSSKFLKDLFPGNEDSGIGIKDGKRALGIPMILMVYPLDNPPYDVNIHLYDVNLKMRKLAIETIVVKYDNGQEVQKAINYMKEFTDSYAAKWDGNGKLNNFPVTRLETTLNAAVTKSKSCTIKIRGYLTDVDGKKIPFETNNHFDYEPPHWRVYRGLGSF